MFQKIYDRLVRVTQNRAFLVLFLPISFGFLLLASVSTSPLYVIEGFDSTIFKTMGLLIVQGGTPYVDYFDHKGPLLWFINALGQWICTGRIGIFILHVFNLWGVCICLFHIACLFLDRVKAVLIVFPMLAFFLLCIGDGNQTQSWVLLPASLVIYLTLRYFILQRPAHFSWKLSFIFGLCFGYAFYIQPNDAVAQIGGLMIGVGLHLLSKKRFKELIRLCACFLGAFLVVTMPIFWYYAVRHAVADCFYGMITFNKLYAGGLTYLTSFWCTPKVLVLLLFVSVMILSWEQGYKQLLYLFIPQGILSCMFMGTKGFFHYYLIYVPIVTCVICFLFKNKYLILAIMLSIPLTIVGCFQCHALKNFILGKNVYWSINNLQMRNFYAETDRLLDFVPVEEQFDIWNFNLKQWEINGNFFVSNSILFHKGLIQSNRAAHCMMDLYDSEFKLHNNLQTTCPKWVLFDHFGEEEVTVIPWLSEDYNFIKSKYTLIARTDTTICDIMLYKRNETATVQQ